MPENVIPVPYRIRCRNCKHPAKYHDLEGCKLKKCDCNIFDAEELEFEHCIDSLTGKDICVQCSSDGKLKEGLCQHCQIFEKKLKKLREENPDWNSRQLRDTAEEQTKEEEKNAAKSKSK